MSELALGGAWAGGWDEPGVLSAVIIASGLPGSGLFLYNGTPAPGNPPVLAAVAPGTTTDPYGNTVSAVLNIGNLAAAHAGFDANGVEYLANSAGTPVIVLDPNKSLIEVLSAGLGSALTASMTTNAGGTDDFGATFQGGITAYGSGTNSAQLLQAALILTGTPGTNTSTIAENGVGGWAPGVRITTSSGAVYAPNGFGGSITADDGTGHPETWHNMTLLNGWANVAGNAVASYRKVGAPVNCVQIRGVIIATAATSGTFFTLPAGYVPGSAGGYGAGANAGVPASQAPQVRWDTSGNLIVASVGTGAANAVWISGLVILDA